MKKLLAVLITLITTLSLKSTGFTLAATNNTGSQFRSGEVVVAGAPGTHLDGLEIVKYLPHANITVVKVESGREFATVQRFMARRRKASLNYIVHATNIPNDPFYSYQWNFTAVQSEQAWDISTGAGVTVAVLDTGLAPSEIDGISCVIMGTDIVNGDNDPYDGNGHGTHVSGTIAQTTGNGTGVVGLAYNACIMPLKVLDDNGYGSFADITDGIYYAVNNGANVINMSLGTDARFKMTNDPIMDPALDFAYQNNVTVVCAAGNDGSLQQVSYPAIYPTTIAVGATDFNNDVTQYSNKGEGLDIVAPGGDIFRDLNNDGYPDGIVQETVIDGEWAYYFFEGTSMASPHVAAVAAMLIAVDPFLIPGNIYQILTSTSLDLNQSGYDTTSGYGLMQAYNSLTSDLIGGETDTDGDGMIDSWELYYGLDINDPSDAYYDFEEDGLTNLEEYNLGTDPNNPDTDNDGFLDGFDGYPLDDQESSCIVPIKNYTTTEVFQTIQAAVDDPNAIDYDKIQITAADFGEDLLLDRNLVLELTGGFYCNYSDNPSTSSINSLTIKNGTLIVESLVVY